MLSHIPHRKLAPISGTLCLEPSQSDGGVLKVRFKEALFGFLSKIAVVFWS